MSVSSIFVSCAVDCIWMTLENSGASCYFRHLHFKIQLLGNKSSVVKTTKAVVSSYRSYFFLYTCGIPPSYVKGKVVAFV